MYFGYSDKETMYLASRCAQMAKLIKAGGHINREINNDLFYTLTNNIVSQQISNKAQASVMQKLTAICGTINPQQVLKQGADAIRLAGMSMRKAQSILGAAQALQSGEISQEKLKPLPDEQVRLLLTNLKGVGEWTADMLMIFSLQRENIFSFGDYGIRKGVEILHSIPKICKAEFEFYKKLYSPYGTVASFYLWELANGNVSLT